MASSCSDFTYSADVPSIGSGQIRLRQCRKLRAGRPLADGIAVTRDGGRPNAIAEVAGKSVRVGVPAHPRRPRTVRLLRVSSRAACSSRSSSATAWPGPSPKWLRKSRQRGPFDMLGPAQPSPARLSARRPPDPRRGGRKRASRFQRIRQRGGGLRPGQTPSTTSRSSSCGDRVRVRPPARHSVRAERDQVVQQRRAARPGSRST